MNDDELDARLGRAAAPAPAVADATLDLLARDARAGGRRSHRRRLIGGLAGGLLALTGGLIAAPAAADGIRDLLARTGETCQGGTECREGEPIIDLSSSDLPELVHLDYPAYLELPPGVTRGDIEQQVAQRLAQQNAVGFESAIGQAYENIAYCGWTAEWLSADDAGDAERRTAAAGVLRRSTEWPAFAGASVDGEWTKVQSFFAQAAEEGDRTGVRAGGSVNACGSTADNIEGTYPQDTEMRAWLDDMAEKL